MLTGIIAGGMAAFFGLGGGAIMASALHSLYPNMPPQAIIANCLGVVFCNGCINSVRFWKLRRIPQWPVLLPLSLSMATGAQIGGRLATQFSASELKQILAFTILVSALRLALTPRPSSPTDPQITFFYIETTPLKTLATLIAGGLGGLISGLTGVGGGLFILPVLILLYRMPTAWLPVYSNPAMALCALSGITVLFDTGINAGNILIGGSDAALSATLSMALKAAPTPNSTFAASLQAFQWCHLNAAVMALLVASSWPSGHWAARLSTRANPKYARTMLIGLLLLIASHLFFQSFAQASLDEKLTSKIY